MCVCVWEKEGGMTEEIEIVWRKRRSTRNIKTEKVLQLNKKIRTLHEKKRQGADLLSQQIFKKNLIIVHSDMNQAQENALSRIRIHVNPQV